MSVEVISHERPRAARPHRCYDCGAWIERGVVHEKMTLKYDGIYTLRIHIDCRQAANEYLSWGYPPDYYDGVPPLYEMISNGDGQRDLDSLRGHWPHVVCRIELGWQKSEIYAAGSGR